MAHPYLSVIIPAYNAASSLPATLIEADQFLASEEYSSELLVVNDGSTDGTAELLEKMTPHLTNAAYIHQTMHQGLGKTLQFGMLAAKGTWRLVISADTAIPLTEFRSFAPHLSSHACDIVVGERTTQRLTISAARTHDHIINICARILFRNIPLYDRHSGFICISQEAVPKIFEHISSKTLAAHDEMLSVAAQAGCRIRGTRTAYAPMRHAVNPQGTLLQTLWELATIRWRAREHARSPEAQT